MNETLRILLVEDDEVDRAAVRRALKSAGLVFQLQEAGDVSAAVDALKASAFDCAILDYQLPDGDAFGVMGRLAEMGARCPPIVVLTGLDDEELGLRLLGAGAQDYLVKGRVSGEGLRRSLRYAMERRRTQEALEAAEAQYRQLVENATDIIYRVDTAGRFTYVNPHTARLLGLPEQQILGRDYLDFVHPSWRQEVRDFYLDVYRNRVLSSSCELPVVARDGREVWLACSTQMMLENGVPVGFQSISRDITERRRAECLREDLTRAIVHDLKNPLTVITGTFDVLSYGESLSPARRELVESAQACAHGMQAMVDAILDIARLETGAMPLERGRLLLAALLAEVLKLEEPLARDKGIRLVSNVPEGLEAWADRDVVRRVFQNLLGNSLKFTPRGGAIRVEAAAEEGMLRVAVSDTGAGIADDTRERLFEKFASGRGAGGGSGLGLAFCRLAVQAHGGRIWVESPSGPGVTFVFTLPTQPEE